MTRSGCLHERATLDVGRDDPVTQLCRLHKHGTTLSEFLPSTWDHLDYHSWDHSARRGEVFSVCSLTPHVLFVDAEVISTNRWVPACLRNM